MYYEEEEEEEGGARGIQCAWKYEEVLLNNLFYFYYLYCLKQKIKKNWFIFIKEQ